MVRQLRLLTFLAPGVNYALALTSVPFRTFFMASALGLFLPLTFVVALIENFMKLWGISLIDTPATDLAAPLAPLMDLEVIPEGAVEWS